MTPMRRHEEQHQKIIKLYIAVHASVESQSHL